MLFLVDSYSLYDKQEPVINENLRLYIYNCLVPCHAVVDYEFIIRFISWDVKYVV